MGGSLPAHAKIAYSGAGASVKISSNRARGWNPANPSNREFGRFLGDGAPPRPHSSGSLGRT